MRIIAGQFKGRNFYMPEGIRPTQNLTRKALFDFLGQDLTGLTFLDLFAGSGGVGLEALSRGAQKVTFVEKDARSCEIVRENLDLLQVPLLGEDRRPVYALIESDGFAAVKGFAREGKKFDIVFADPPYGAGLAKKILKTLGAYDIVSPNCVVVIQHEKRETLPEIQGGLHRSEQRKYGSTALSIYKSNS
ncbi:MAG: 16S rRNA (guanine(966)-N(2))-methyltransferase RsmD [Candidatus Omnitrophica bacterium]|nr:16S rRNA (guanine(966)-N(2))-methyltransferase RsmD [Candidatus Omnitrophota bacterium]